GLQIGLVLDQLLGAAMQEADMRIDALDQFSVQFEYKTQNTMGCRMLRPEVDVEVADRVLGHGRDFASVTRCAGRDGRPGKASRSRPSRAIAWTCPSDPTTTA